MFNSKTPPLVVPTLLAITLFMIRLGDVMAQTATDFPGTVLSVDAGAGKFAVKKADTGTRFTFAVNEKTRFGEGLKGLADLKKGDHVTVTYSVVGGQYVAQNVVKGK